jgi:hypothetical protein
MAQPKIIIPAPGGNPLFAIPNTPPGNLEFPGAMAFVMSPYCGTSPGMVTRPSRHRDHEAQLGNPWLASDFVVINTPTSADIGIAEWTPEMRDLIYGQENIAVIPGPEGSGPYAWLDQMSHPY